jgi:hypothetical protein
MDFDSVMKVGGASAGLITIVGIIAKVIQSFCGHRLRSECCGHEATVGVKVENMQSPQRKPSVVVIDVEDKKIPESKEETKE